MNLESFYMIAGILAAVGGLMKYVFYSIDKHKEAVTERFEDHAEKLKENKEAIKANEHAVNDVRDEMHKEYVHKTELDSLSERFDRSFNAMFKKLDAVAKDVNRLVGRSQVKDDEE